MPRKRLGEADVVPLPGDLPRYVAYVDGSCPSNPGPMGIGVVIEPEGGGPELIRVGAQVGCGTNNEAEYWALLTALRLALRYGMVRLRVQSDSQLMVRQVNGEYKVKQAGLRRLHKEAHALLDLFDQVSVAWVPRDDNKADDLSRTLEYTVPYLPPPPRYSRFRRQLQSWQAALIRVWMAREPWRRDGDRCVRPSERVVGRVFDLEPTSIAQIGHGVTYTDANFDHLPNWAEGDLAKDERPSAAWDFDRGASDEDD